MFNSDLSVAPTVNPYSTGLDVSGFSIEDVFPEVDPEFTPYGAKVLVQLRRVMNTTKSGLIVVNATKETEAWNQQVGKLIAAGPLAFKNRQTGQPWPEGMWAQLGDFVRVPRHVGDRVSVPVDERGEHVVILIMDDHQLMGRYTGNPLKPRAYIE